MNTEVKISVIVPVYNVEKYLPRCIDSILNQTYKNLEIILVDDGSPDNCPAICDEYAQKDSRIKVIHKANGGVSSARNAGIDVATGEYIGFVDSDDWIEPDMYEYLLINATKYKAEISKCGYFVSKSKTEHTPIGEDNGTFFSQEPIEKRKTIISNIENASICTAIYKRWLFDHYRLNSNLRIAEDRLLNYQFSTISKSIVITNKHLYHYFSNIDSVTHEDSIDKFMDNMCVVEYFWEHEINEPLMLDSLSNIYTYITMSLVGMLIRKNLCYTEEYNYIRTSLKEKKKYLLKAKINRKRYICMVIFLYFPKLYIDILQRRNRKHA